MKEEFILQIKDKEGRVIYGCTLGKEDEDLVEKMLDKITEASDYYT